MEIHIAVIDNGDTQPELWAFSSYKKAKEFNAVCGGHIQSLPVIVRNSDADKLIFDERIKRS